MSTSALQPFDSTDKEFIFSLKRKFSLNSENVNNLWEIYLKLYGRYPNHEKTSPCGKCITEVLDDCISKINSNEERLDELMTQIKEPKKKKNNGTNTKN